jgi:CheY-like chemotaxis protein
MTQHPDRRHILFVDDEAAIQRLVDRVLRAGLPGVRVTCVSDGAAALEVLDREPVHLLITDLAMPGVDGLELLRQVTNRRIMLPIMVVTGKGSPTHEERALAGGAVEYYEKPFQPEAFVRCVKNLLDAAEHRSRIEGVSIAGFVQLLDMERKTCALWASVEGDQGVLFFQGGALVDARQGGLSGAAAALEIFMWKDPIITLEVHSRVRTATIHIGLTELLLESARLADERERNLRRSMAQGRSSARSEVVPVMAAAPVSAGRGPTLSLVPPIVSAEQEFTLEEFTSMAPELSGSPSTVPQSGPGEGPAAQAAITQLLAEVMKIDGALGAAVANWELDHCLGTSGEHGPLRVDMAVAGNCRVMRALVNVMTKLGFKGQVQDVLITLDQQAHIIWPLAKHEGLFLYVAVDRARSNPTLTRLRLQKIVDAQGL